MYPVYTLLRNLAAKVVKKTHTLKTTYMNKYFLTVGLAAKRNKCRIFA